MHDDRRDIVRWITDWLLADEQAITQSLELRCQRLERAARDEFGGQRVQVWRTMTGKVGRPKATEPGEPALHGDGGPREALYRLLKK